MTNRDLLMSVLSMDAYNRGYGAGIINSKLTNGIGDATILSLSSSLLDSNGIPLDAPASFAAVSYTSATYGTIISYRGTDSAYSDVLSGAGSGIALGLPNSPQGYLAAQFYQSVIQNQNPYLTDVTFTGHSLGGGLGLR